MVVFDNNFLMIALRPNIPASVDHAKERVSYLLESLQKAGERVVVPTPVLTELLVRAEQAASVYLDELQKSSKFKVAPFGVRAAVEVAAVISSAIKRKNKKDGSAETWAKVNFDRQIAAIGKIEGAHTIYTDDGNLQKFAELMGLKFIALKDTELPPDPHPLLTGVGALEGLNEQKTQGEAGNTAELRANDSSGTGNTAGKKEDEQAKADSASKSPTKQAAILSVRPSAPQPTTKGGLDEDGS